MHMWVAVHCYYEKPHKVIGTVANKKDSNFLIRSEEPTILTTIDNNDNNKEDYIFITNHIGNYHYLN